jgi:hypothetical protein
MTYNVSLTEVSRNSKTGPIPVSTTEASTCPPTCAEFETCYAKYGHISIHWKAVTKHTRGCDWGTFCRRIRVLPHGQLWRHNQAGDLPGDGKNIDADALLELVKANKGRRGFTYTHYPLNVHNLLCIEGANALGFTVNISCDSLTHSDLVRKITRAPLSVVVPSTVGLHGFFTLNGNHVVVCPATYRDDMNCLHCGICQDRSPNRAVIAFPAHGTKKRIIDIKLAKENA